MKLYLLTCSIGLSLAFGSAAAQEAPEPGRLVVAQLHGGVRYEGVYQGDEAGYAVIQPQQGGEVRLAFSSIQRLEMVPPERFFNGEYWPEPRVPSQNLLSPTSFMPQPGEVYFKHIMLALNHLNFGISERFSAGVIFPMLDMLSLVQFGGNVPFGLNAKVSLSNPDNLARFGTGALVLRLPERGFISAAIMYGTVTYGTPDRNFSFGLGHGFADGRWSANPSYILSGHYRVSKKFALQAEGWVFQPVGLAAGTVGFKILGQRLDWGFSFPAFSFEGESMIFPVPIVSFNTVIHRFSRDR